MSNLVERLLDYARDDHERGCQGRNYDCTCGYDDKRDPLLEEAAARIERLREVLKNVQHSRVLQGKAISDAAAEIERLRAALKPFASLTVDGEAADAWASKFPRFYQLVSNARAALEEKV